jgi:hypothetical protein
MKRRGDGFEWAAIQQLKEGEGKYLEESPDGLYNFNFFKFFVGSSYMVSVGLQATTG